MDGFVFLILGLGALFAVSSLIDGSDASNADDEDNREEERLSRDADGRFVLNLTSGSDTITPLDLESVQSEIDEVSSFFRLSEIQAGDGDDKIFADIYGDPDNPDRYMRGQDGIEIHAGAGDDIVLSHGTFSNTLYGGPGNDTLAGVGADIYGGSGDDLILARSYYLGEEAQVLKLRGGPGDDTIGVQNGFADIRGGEGADTFILEFDRPASDERFPLDRSFPSMGDVVIRDFDPQADRLFILLPPAFTNNVELTSILRVGEDTRFTVAVTIAPDLEFPEGTTFSANITLLGVDVEEDIAFAHTDEGFILSVNAPPEVPVLPSLPV